MKRSLRYFCIGLANVAGAMISMELKLYSTVIVCGLLAICWFLSMAAAEARDE